MSTEAEPLLDEYLDAAAEERNAWHALPNCDHQKANAQKNFCDGKGRVKPPRKIAARWQAAIGMRRVGPLNDAG
jgi:hypothetical protein